MLLRKFVHRQWPNYNMLIVKRYNGSIQIVRYRWTILYQVELLHAVFGVFFIFIFAAKVRIFSDIRKSVCTIYLIFFGYIKKM